MDQILILAESGGGQALPGSPHSRSVMPTQHRILSLVYNEFEALDLFGALGAIVPRSDYYTLKLVNVHNLSALYGLESSIKNGIGTLPQPPISRRSQGRGDI